MTRILATILALWFGFGCTRKGPGTIGSLGGIPVAWGLMYYTNQWGLLAGTLLISLIGWWAASVYIRHTGKKDPSEVVIDEVAGQCLTFGVAFIFIPDTPMAYMVGFAFFRVFDIIKYGPVGWAERRFHGGLGIMADDLVAGVLAGLSLALTMFIASFF